MYVVHVRHGSSIAAVQSAHGGAVASVSSVIGHPVSSCQSRSKQVPEGLWKSALAGNGGPGYPDFQFESCRVTPDLEKPCGIDLRFRKASGNRGSGLSRHQKDTSCVDEKNRLNRRQDTCPQCPRDDGGAPGILRIHRGGSISRLVSSVSVEGSTVVCGPKKSMTVASISTRPRSPPGRFRDSVGLD